MTHNHFQLIVIQRIAEHKAAEEKKEAETREQIRAEEQAKAEKEAREKVEREQREEAARVAEEARQAAEAAEAAKPAATPAPAAAAAPATLWNGPRNPDGSCAPISSASIAAAPANVVPMGTRPPAPESTATIRLGQINERLAPIQLTAEGLATLGFTPVATEKAAKLFREADLPRIRAKLIAHLEAMSEQLAA